MKLCGAIDLHSNNNVTVLSNEKDEVVYRKRLPNDLKLILGQLAPYQSEIAGIVVESTYNWYWLVDGLMEQGYRVHLANTAAIQQYNGLKSNTFYPARRYPGAVKHLDCHQALGIKRYTLGRTPGQLYPLCVIPLSSQI